MSTKIKAGAAVLAATAPAELDPSRCSELSDELDAWMAQAKAGYIAAWRTRFEQIDAELEPVLAQAEKLPQRSVAHRAANAVNGIYAQITALAGGSHDWDGVSRSATPPGEPAAALTWLGARARPSAAPPARTARDP